MSVNVAEVLRYGAIGLGFLLAFLTYLLLRREQANEQPRRQFLTPIYVFMAFSLVLCGAGFTLEYSQNAEKSDLLAAQAVVQALLEQKVGALDRLQAMDPGSESYFDLVAEITRQLSSIDESLGEALSGGP